MPAARVRLPAGPLDRDAFGSRGARSPNKGPADWGSFQTPRRSNASRSALGPPAQRSGRRTDGSRIRLGRVALLKRWPLTGREGSNPSPSASALVVKRKSCRASNAVFQVRILAEALSEARNSEFGTRSEDQPRSSFRTPSSAFRARTILWPSGSGRLPDTEEVGGSIPPRITGEEDRDQRTEARGQQTTPSVF
jgi:hypothetical protein